MVKMGVTQRINICGIFFTLFTVIFFFKYFVEENVTRRHPYLFGLVATRAGKILCESFWSFPMT